MCSPQKVCSVHEVTIITYLSYSNRSLLKKWHFLDLVCSLLVLTIISGLSYSDRSLLKKWHFPDLICAVLNLFSVPFSPQKVALFRPDMCNTCSKHQNRNILVGCPLLKKWHFPDPICAIHVVTSRVEVY
jgi:hypothetical protein